MRWNLWCDMRITVVVVLLGASFASATQPPWSFKPVASPAAPEVKNGTWPRADLDRFILAKLETKGLAPNPPADRVTLIRRLSFDLLGLPPSPEEVDAFVADRSTEEAATARLVDRLLDSPRFGERWGRHWLDVVRYADSVGRSWNAPFTYSWRYRDYVIDAFNADRPYDRFILEQLAGDLIPSSDTHEARQQRIATGFLAIGSVPIQEGSLEQFRLDRVDDQIDVTTRAFLGLTIACARCHNHKTDPISTRDYYALAGAFYSTRILSGQGTHSREEGSQDYVDGNLLVRLPGSKPRTPNAREVHTMSDVRDVASTGVRGSIRYTYDPDRAMGAMEGEIKDCAIRVKGDPYDTKPAPPRGDVKIPGLTVPSKVPTGSSGRLQMARWIASTQNPLTARVMVNRVWLHLFGKGLVPTPDDFGTTGEEPTHPELLDHLASRFMAESWSVKRLIRSLVTSQIYRQSSAGRADGREKDPGNTLYWRANLRRLEFEPIRDSLLAAANRLAFERPEGIPVAGTGGKGRAAPAHSLLRFDHPCRTVYLPVLRSLVPEVYGTFDFPDPCSISGKREITTVAPQSLFFLNSDFVSSCASDAAEAIAKKAGPSVSQRVRLTYRRLLGRAPTAEEEQDALRLVKNGSWPSLTQALMASAEFRYVR